MILQGLCFTLSFSSHTANQNFPSLSINPKHNMSMRRFLANSIYKFPCRRSSASSCSLPFPLMMRNGNQLVTYHHSPRLFSTKILSSSNASEFDFNAYSLDKINSINQALDESVPLKEPLKVHEAMRYSLLSKCTRIFPLLCIASCELVGGTESTVMPVACAMEMFVAGWLVADDLPCMDNDDFRRGKLSTHKVFGESMAILVSYSLFALAFEHIAKVTKLGVPSANIVRVLSESARLLIGAEGVAGGQAADMDAQGKSGIGIEQVEYIYLHKSSAVFEGSAVAGAIIGGASEEEINRLRKYSKYAGLIFQIKDDILDEENDLIADKLTYPKLIGKEKSMKVLEKLIGEAEDQLEGFDPEKAAPLKALVHYIAN
ncbi:hypothetical protein M9H77_05468 [Catharanthus roseus]|uniref:Uncharacterized protein n=1 Tax=Catharanthus roseus TaxID=4058 RepID=A0ACC0CH69_CATRO|nr:hypothetical protein M9H77_05468 [Catharanthus roseus]